MEPSSSGGGRFEAADSKEWPFFITKRMWNMQSEIQENFYSHIVIIHLNFSSSAIVASFQLLYKLIKLHQQV